jgi:vanillate O-demethylase ferredoxin subunit
LDKSSWNELVITRRENGADEIIIDLPASDGNQLSYVSSGSHIDVEVSFASDVEKTGAAFTVQTRTDGRAVRVNAGQTIAAALLEAGIDVPLSCEQGVCGTCLVGVLAGVLDYRDVYQTDEEEAANTHIACCRSRALSDGLILDL